MDRSLDRTGNSSITDIFRPTSEVDCGGISPRDEGHQLRRRSVAGFSVFFHLLVFSCLYFFLLFEALNLELSFWAALIIQTVIGLGVILPAAPGHVGNFEYFTVLGLALFGITQEAAFAYALLAHICEFIPVTVVGLFFALRNGFQQQVEAVGEV